MKSIERSLFIMNLQRAVAIILVLCGAASYGFLSPMIKLAYNQGFGVQQITLTQVTISCIMIWLFVIFHRKSWQNPFKGPWIKLGLIGVFGLAMTTFLFNMCLTYLDVSFAIVLLFQFTWITVLMNCISQKRWPRAQEVWAVLIILLGTIFAVDLEAYERINFNPMGIILGLGSAICYAWFLFMMDKVKSEFTSLMKSALMLTLAIPVMYILYIPSLDSLNLSPALVLWGIVLGLLGQIIPTISFNLAIPRIGSSLSAILGAVELPVAVVSAFFILHEPVSWTQWTGIIIILMGIVISEKKSIVK